MIISNKTQSSFKVKTVGCAPQRRQFITEISQSYKQQYRKKNIIFTKQQRGKIYLDTEDKLFMEVTLHQECCAAMTLMWILWGLDKEIKR